jgi:hypothetical protein
MARLALHQARRAKDAMSCEHISMPIQIELPERLVDALEIRARQLHSTVEAVAIEAIEKDMNKVETGTVPGRRVQLPLIRSAKPGSLRSLTNAEIDGILG